MHCIDYSTHGVMILRGDMEERERKNGQKSLSEDTNDTLNPINQFHWKPFCDIIVRGSLSFGIHWGWTGAQAPVRVQPFENCWWEGICGMYLWFFLFPMSPLAIDLNYCFLLCIPNKYSGQECGTYDWAKEGHWHELNIRREKSQPASNLRYIHDFKDVPKNMHRYEVKCWRSW